MPLAGQAVRREERGCASSRSRLGNPTISPARLGRHLAVGPVVCGDRACSPRTRVRRCTPAQDDRASCHDKNFRSVIDQPQPQPVSFFKNAKLAKRFPVATGQAIYPTPTGRFEIVVKQLNPWWYPPTQDAWAKGLKPVPPGPCNPLGTRWMGLSAPGVGIHGTDAPRRSGTASRTAASACRFPTRSGCSPRSTSARPCSSSDAPPAAGARGECRERAARAARLGSRALEGRQDRGGGRQRQDCACAGLQPRAARQERDAVPRVAAREGRRPQLLAVVVRAVQGRARTLQAGSKRWAGKTSSSSASTSRICAGPRSSS